ncbi:MAG: aminoglycoside phosphotransferase family protein, partial [Planctomycetota bacterium]
MHPIDPGQLTRYMADTLGQRVSEVSIRTIDQATDQDLKEYGYGEPLAIDYRVNGTMRRAVLHTISPGPFGHQHMADRAGDILWSHTAFNRLPRHVRSFGVGAFDRK